MSRSNAAVRCWFVSWVSVSTIAGCGAFAPHDDYPQRVKKGCSSMEECIALVREGRARFFNCKKYLVGNREKAYSKHHLCSYEQQDFLLAVQKANEWLKRPYVVTSTSGTITGHLIVLSADAGTPEPTQRILE